LGISTRIGVFCGVVFRGKSASLANLLCLAFLWRWRCEWCASSSLSARGDRGDGESEADQSEDAEDSEAELASLSSDALERCVPGDECTEELPDEAEDKGTASLALPLGAAELLAALEPLCIRSFSNALAAGNGGAPGDVASSMAAAVSVTALLLWR
jgi:hypothetical protein